MVGEQGVKGVVEGPEEQDLEGSGEPAKEQPVSQGLEVWCWQLVALARGCAGLVSTTAGKAACTVFVAHWQGLD